jgi:hypothetical protein
MDALGSKIVSLVARPDRRLAGRLAAAIVAGCLLAPGTAAATPVAAKSADSFVGSIGVNTHTYYTNTVYYSRFPEVKAKLAELGVRNIRENLRPSRSDQYQRLNELAATGIKSTLIMGDPREGTSGLNTLLSIAKTNLKGSIAALEGPNEYDNQGIANWLSPLIGYQEYLYKTAKADPALSSLPVIGPSLVHQESQEATGDISRMLDYGNIHSYPNGYTAESNLTTHLSHEALVSGSKPIMATETGYHTALGWTGGHYPVSEQAMAVYVPRLFLEYYRRGVVKTFSYELLDEAAGSTDREDNFGLLHNDLTPKPAFTALGNMIDILEDPGSSFSSGALDYTLGGNQENLRQVLLQKRDGSFYLALWRATSVWDPVNKVALNPGSAPVSISFGQPVSSVQLYAPNESSSVRSSVSAPSGTLSYEVGPQVKILHIVPGEGSPAPAPEPTPTPTEPTPTEPTPTPTEPTPTEPTPTPTPTEEPAPATEESTKKGGKSSGSKGGGRKRLALWTSRRSVRAGQPLAIRARVIAPTPTPVSSTPVAIQRWQQGWRTVDRGQASSDGLLDKRITVAADGESGIARIRVVAPAAIPSRSITVRVRG